MEEKLYQNKGWLHHHYIELEESSTCMAKMANCQCTTILRSLRRFDIPVRTRYDGIFLAKRNYLDPSRELFDLLEGELLGDGCITMQGRRSARYSHSSKYREYLAWLSGIFADLGLKQTGKIQHIKETAFPPHEKYLYASKCYPELVGLQRRWYPNGKKIVPHNLILTPPVCLRWYLGDGSFKRKKNYTNLGIQFHTEGFTWDDVELLRDKMKQLGFKTSHWADNVIYLGAKSIEDFFNYIGPCPIDCYAYKWDYRDNRRIRIRINPRLRKCQG